MARRTVSLVLREAEAAWRDKRAWEQLLRSCYLHAMPERNPYFSGDGTGQDMGTPGQPNKGARVFDSTLMESAIKLANRIQTELVPPGRVWARFVPGDLVKREMREQARIQLAQIQAALFTAIQLSSFDTAINEWLLELVIAGTAIMGVLKPNDDLLPLEFMCIPQSQVALREGADGRIHGFYRKFKLRAGLIVEKWPEAKLPQQVLSLPEDQRDEAELRLFEALYFVPGTKTWYYDVILEGQSGANGERGNHSRIVERTYKDGQWIAARWIKAVGETHGRSPVMMALPDFKTLNRAKELMLQNASLALKGAWMVRNDGVVNAANVRIFPGATIAVRSTGGTVGASIQRLDVGGDIQLAQLVIEDLVSSVRAIMLNKSLPPETGAVRSATEIVQRLKEIQMDLGSPLGRIIREGIIPMMQVALGVLGQEGIVPTEADGRAMRLDGALVKVNMLSPLVQAQNLTDVEQYVNWGQIVTALGGREVFMLGCNVEDMPAYLADKMGVDPEQVRPEEDRKQIQNIIGAMLQQATGGVGAPGGVGGQQQQQPQGAEQPQLALAA